MITRHRFRLESSNLHQTCIMGIGLVRAITRHGVGLESPNFYQTCILWYSRLALIMRVIDLDLQCQFGHSDSRILGNLARPRYNSECISARFTQYALDTHHGILSAGIENGDFWPRPSRSLGHFGVLCVPNVLLFLLCVRVFSIWWEKFFSWDCLTYLSWQFEYDVTLKTYLSTTNMPRNYT